MILVDANLLIYAHHKENAFHRPAKEWLEAQLNGQARVGFPWPSLLAFLRIVTNPRVFRRPDSLSNAWKTVRAWLDCDMAWIPVPTDRHVESLARLIDFARPSPNLVADAHLAALALEHGLTVCSTDGDFARFKGVRWVNPLADES